MKPKQKRLLAKKLLAEKNKAAEAEAKR